MELEFYVNGDDIPPLYDCLIDTRGRVWEMAPKPSRPSSEYTLRQYVLERVEGGPNRNQRLAIERLIAEASRVTVRFNGIGPMHYQWAPLPMESVGNSLAAFATSTPPSHLS